MFTIIFFIKSQYHIPIKTCTHPVRYSIERYFRNISLPLLKITTNVFPRKAAGGKHFCFISKAYAVACTHFCKKF